MTFTPSIPDHLRDEILAGRCVALVGAGFSAAAELPLWRGLLNEVVRRADAERLPLPDLSALLGGESGHALDQAAQLIEDAIHRKHFVRLVKDVMRAARRDLIAERLEHLKGIPFRAILTTNFDALLQARGSDASVSSYEAVLRPGARPLFERTFWNEDLETPVIKLHGDVESDDDLSLVLTRRDYRRRLYEDAGYTTFLRAVLASTTVLYLGFSFTDAYLNELRSEVLAMLDGGRAPRGKRPLIAYAVAADVPVPVVRHFERHERIGVLSFPSNTAPRFAGFDQYLEALHRETNPLARFARSLGSRRVLWLDESPENNQPGTDLLARGHRYNAQYRWAMVSTPEDAVESLGRAALAGEAYDLVITRYGEFGRDERPRSVPVALTLLDAMRARDIRAPVLVFASNRDVHERTRRVIAKGALGYFHTFEDLFQEIQHLCASTARRSPPA